MSGPKNHIAGPYCIGSDKLNGLSKLIEESGEMLQTLGKMIAIGSMGDHWDGTNLKDRVEDEIADVLAAIKFFAEKNGLDHEKMRVRKLEKYDTFCQWDHEQKGSS